MPQFSTAVKSISAVIIIKSDYHDDIKKIRLSNFLKSYIPNASIEKLTAKADCVLTIKRGQPRIDLLYPLATYYCRSFDEKDVISLAEYLLERARQKSNLYCLHGSTCLIDGQAVIFWGGASGLGKTSLCQKLSEEFGAEWLADEKIVIDLKNEKIVGGIKVAYLKNSKHQPLKYQSEPKKSVPIAFFVQPLLMPDSCRELIFDKWPMEKFRWHLFEEANRKIRATSRLFFNGTEPVLSLDTLPLARQRIKLIKKFTKKHYCYYARGNYSNIGGKIIKYVKQ